MATASERTAQDPVTGKPFTIKTEDAEAAKRAAVSGVCLLLQLILFLLALVELWSGHYRLLKIAEYTLGPAEVKASHLFRVLGFAFIGGGLGAVINEYRSFLFWHAEKGAFGARFIWKSIGAPWIGATLALVTIALLKSGIAVLGGVSTDASTFQSLSMFAIGSLVGYGSSDVSKWLDVQVKRTFAIKPPSMSKVPDLVGKDRKQAEAALKEVKLKMGAVNTAKIDDASLLGKIVEQSQPAGSSAPRKTVVDVTVGEKK